MFVMIVFGKPNALATTKEQENVTKIKAGIKNQKQAMPSLRIR